MERFLKSKLQNGQFSGLTPDHSRRMAAIRGVRNRTTEVTLRMSLVRAGIEGWVLHQKMLGRPDFYFPVAKLAVFVDGCFWHGCTKCGHVPNRNRPYWSAKLERNRQRDELVSERLRESGVFVLRFWEHELRNDSNFCLETLQTVLGVRNGHVQKRRTTKNPKPQACQKNPT